MAAKPASGKIAARNVVSRLIRHVWRSVTFMDDLLQINFSPLITILPSPHQHGTLILGTVCLLRDLVRFLGLTCRGIRPRTIPESRAPWLSAHARWSHFGSEQSCLRAIPRRSPAPSSCSDLTPGSCSPFSPPPNAPLNTRLTRQNAEARQTSFAWPVCCSASFGVSPAIGHPEAKPRTARASGTRTCCTAAICPRFAPRTPRCSAATGTPVPKPRPSVP